MKKYLKIVIPLTFMVILGYFGFQIVSKINHKKEVANNIKTIPTFNFENTKGGNFTHESLQAGIPTIFVYFSSECEFCSEEAQMMQDNDQTWRTHGNFRNCKFVDAINCEFSTYCNAD